MSVKRGGATGGRGGRGGSASQRGGFQMSEDAPSHAQRAADLLARARLSQGGGTATTTTTTTTKPSAATASSLPPTKTPLLSTSEEGEALSTKPISIPDLLKRLANPSKLGAHAAMSVKEAIPVAGKLVRAKLNTEAQLAFVTEVLLERAGISSEAERHKVLVALGARSGASGSGSSGGAGGAGKRKVAETSSAAAAKRRRQMDDVALSRDYGNYDPNATNGKRKMEDTEYYFNEILDAEVLRTRYAFVNRAPVMTAWTTVVLERLGFQRAEALSLAHVYVDTTSTSRGISIGVYDESRRDRTMTMTAANQPHFELMGLKIPVMRMSSGQGQWRGILRGEVVGPEKAFNYLKKSMAQTLPMVMGALSLLADSYVERPPVIDMDDFGTGALKEEAAMIPGNATQRKEEDSIKVKEEVADQEGMSSIKKLSEPPQEDLKPFKTEVKTEATKEEEVQQGDNSSDDSKIYGPDVLHAHAYSLYCEFRPSTGGEWGKKAKLELGKVLALRNGDIGVEAWEGGRMTREEKEEKEWEAELARLAEDGQGIDIPSKFEIGGEEEREGKREDEGINNQVKKEE